MVISVLLALVFAGAGANKFSQSELAEAAPDHLGITRGTYRLVGVLELLAAAGLIVGAIALPWLGGLAALGLGLLMLGALALHQRAGDPFAVGKGFMDKSAESIKGSLPAAVLMVIAFVDAALILG